MTVLARFKKPEWYVALALTVISIIATTYYYQQKAILLYPDAVARLEIARRFLDSATPGFGQLGGVWLPLPQLLMQPFVYIDGLYYSGLAGSIVSMVSYIIAGLYVYKIARGLGMRQAASLATLSIFALNPNVLYLQSTPMSELPLFCAIVAMTYYVQEWLQTAGYTALFKASVASLAGSLTRYEAWVITATFMVVVAFVAWKRHGYRRAEGTILGFSFLGVSGIIGWVAWNWIIFDNPLNWQNGQYARSSLWVGSNEPSLGLAKIAIETYWYAVTDNISLVISIGMFAGAVALIALRHNVDILATLSLFVLWPFFIVALYLGQRPLHVMQISNDLYNVRFGLLMIIPASITIGYLISLLDYVHAWATVTISIVVIATISFFAYSTTTPVLRVEPQVWTIASRYDASSKAADYLRTNYQGGNVLVTFFGNEYLFFRAKIPLRNNIYEGNYRLWEAAVHNPVNHQVKWIILRPNDSTDIATTYLNATNLSQNGYVLVYNQHNYQIWRR